ncbi:MAG: hypothetical protein AB2807_09975 [Candidatus Sedimenticola endophacoides]
MFLAEFFIAVFALVVAGLLVAQYVFGVQPAAIGARAGELVRPAVPFVRRHRKKFLVLALLLAPFMFAVALMVLVLIAASYILRHTVSDERASRVRQYYVRYYDDDYHVYVDVETGEIYPTLPHDGYQI